MTQINPNPEQAKVQPSAPNAAPGTPSPDKTAAQVAQEILQARVPVQNGIDPATLQILMQAMMPIVGAMAREMAIELRKPTPEEAKKLEAERDRLLAARKQAAESGRLETQMIKQQQTQCQHQKPNGEHTFRGIVHSNGWAVIKCQRCLIPFTVRPLPEHIQNGLNLNEIRGLTVEHLRAWEANSKKIDEQIRKSQEAMAGMSTQFANMAPAAGL
jgi:hypothetical protein